MTKNRLVLIFIILWTAFIFCNSMMGAESSIEESSKAAELVEKTVSVFYKGEPPEKVTNFFKTKFLNLIRDFAHFFEFFILGILIMLYSFKYSFKSVKRILLVILFCFLISLVDETLQLFSPGRAFEVSDLVKDGSGSILGSMAVFFISRFKHSY